MMTAAKKMIIYVIHHSHTDVGYTDTQEKIKAHHIGFIKEVIALIKTEPSFKWNCESYWCVEQFLLNANGEEINDFIKYVKSGNICISGSYLNLTELINEKVLNETMDNCVSQLKSFGLKAESAMTADINGYSWGYSDALINHNISGLMSCIHTHHGYHPLFKKQTPFYWIAPSGKKLLVWNGEHYLLGNELGIAQASEFEYTLQDGLTFSKLNSFDKAVKRIFAYSDSLTQQGHEYNYFPVSVSGNMTDNSPPSILVLDFINKFNSLYAEQIEIKMSTLDEFFALLKKEKNIPEFSGDWTDWWADGIGSTPSDVSHYRAAARRYSVAKKLDADCKIVDASVYKDALYNLMFYAEHTWGYSSSITEPYHPQVNNLDQWKRLFALKANEQATIATEKLQRYFGETQISLHKQLGFKAVNPHDIAVKDMLVCDLEHFYGFNNFDVIDDKNGKSVPYQISKYSRGMQLCLFLDMAPHEEKSFSLKNRGEEKLKSAGKAAKCGIEGIYDLNYQLKRDEKNGGSVFYDEIDNEFFTIKYSVPAGITSIFDKKRNVELIKSGKDYNAFTPIYEVTERDMGEDYLWVRRNMGRNRKAVRTKRSAGQLYDVKVLENGDLYLRAELKYRLEGVTDCSVILTVFKLLPKIKIDFRLHKTSVWEPENLYLSLPFTAGKTGEVYIDKTGAVLRPRIDQLPGTCTDFYASQNGVAFIGDRTVLITASDAPLLAMGKLEAHPIKLMGEDVSNCDNVYSWVMNNFWETNFKASLGGFYQFSYSLNLLEKTNPKEVFKEAEAINEGVLQFYQFKDKRI